MHERTRRAAAVVTWLYAAGFGLPAIPIAIVYVRTGTLPTFLDLFPMYGGPWSRRMPIRGLAGALVGFFLLTIVTAWSAWHIWNGSRRGAALNLALIVPEAVFWIGFALPIPWLLAMARVALIVTSLSKGKPGRALRRR